jgi:hypothetical protein
MPAADSLLTLAQTLQINDMSIRDMGASNIFQETPFLASLPVVEANLGTSHKFLRETTAPTVGFRPVNTGLDFTAGADTAVTVALSYLDATVKMDKALADVGKGRDYQLQRQAMRNLRTALFQFETSVLVGGLSNGFNGLQQALSALGTYCISAGASGARTSVYVICASDDETRFNLLMGNGNSLQMDPYYETLIPDADGKTFNGYVLPITGWGSIQLNNAASAVRIANVGTGATLTDALLSQAFQVFPAGMTPTHIVMNRRSRGELQRSRTAIQGGSKSNTTFAAIPTEYEGVPIYISEALGIAETAVT